MWFRAPLSTACGMCRTDNSGLNAPARQALDIFLIRISLNLIGATSIFVLDHNYAIGELGLIGSEVGACVPWFAMTGSHLQLGQLELRARRYHIGQTTYCVTNYWITVGGNKFEYHLRY
jgi:hypothetical protein